MMSAPGPDYPRLQPNMMRFNRTGEMCQDE
jgi:hypothetical protein